MKDLENLRHIITTAKLRHFEEGTKVSNDSRLQVRVPSELVALVEKLAIVMGCKRAEVVSLAISELAENVDPQLLST